MGTAKRERQKVNRQLRLQELAKQARKEKSKRVGLRIGLVIGAVVVGVGAIAFFGGDDNETAASTTTSLAEVTTSTIDPNTPTTLAPEKPVVSLPATLPTELVVTPLREGTGELSKLGDTIDVHYIGVLSADGTEFDNSYDRGESFPVTLGETSLIAGWTQGLVGLQAGGQYQLDIPAELAYGAEANGDIPPNSALTFVIDVMAITPAPAA